MPNRLISGNRSLTHDELRANALKIAQGFHELGIRQKDTVALMLRNSHAFIEAWLAAGILGAYSVPINWHFNVEEARYIFDDSDAKVLVIHADLFTRIKPAFPDDLEVLVVETPEEIQKAYRIADSLTSAPPGEREWNHWFQSYPSWAEPPQIAPFSMIYTSGTTGYPKGVRRDIPSPELAEKTRLVRKKTWGVHAGAKVLMTGPLYHSAPYAMGTTAVYEGSEIIMQPRFDAEEMLQMIETYKITHMHMVPTMFVRLLKLPQEIRNKYDLASLEYVIHGAAPCPKDVKRAMLEWWGPILYEYYGGTESGIVGFSTSEDWLKYPGTVGKVCEWAKLKVLDDHKQHLPPNEVGDLYLIVDYQSDFTYHKKEKKRQEIEEEGLITIGDRGYVNEEGYIFLSDRRNDMVISGGVNIYPAEIEKELIMMPGIKDCAIFGIPDDEFGESLIGYIELEEEGSLTAEAIQQFLIKRVAKYKIPKLIKFQNNLPREDSGKIFKRKLRDPYWEKLDRNI